mmetsp:Transcript_9594/g.22023  ORF Transcript_9594/g.22023 Transcript_9594/m.22023 type:complete len:137 (-) Transcript_9594:2319-2729(-)
MTVVIVAHRLSTVRNADCIFVVDNGKVVEKGSHDELVQIENGHYNALISRQINAQGKLEKSTSAASLTNVSKQGKTDRSILSDNQNKTDRSIVTDNQSKTDRSLDTQSSKGGSRGDGVEGPKGKGSMKDFANLLYR